MQAFNSAGTTVAPIFGGMLILGRSTGGTAGPGDVALTSAQQAADAQAVELPYVLIAVVLVALAVLVWRVRMPDLAAENRRAAREERKHHSLWHHRNLVFGRTRDLHLPDRGDRHRLDPGQFHFHAGDRRHEPCRGGKLLSLFWGGAMAGRFLGAWADAQDSAGTGVGGSEYRRAGVDFDGGGHRKRPLAMWCLIAVGLCHSVMFPTIFTLGIRGLGP